MVNDKIAVVRIGVVLKTGQIHAGMVFMVVLYRSGNTGIQQFNAAQISDIGFYHQRIHSLDTGIDPHHFSDFFTQILDTVMKQIHAVGTLIFITAAAKPGQCFVTQRLFFKTGSAQCVLIVDVQHQILHHFVIREVKEFFDDQCSNDDVYRSIWSGCIFRV